MSKNIDVDRILLEERKVKALERIAISIDALSLWFEEVEKEEWGDRMQFYLSEFHKLVTPPAEVEDEV
jgi:hypothetical protein|tara:strand:+ start:1516 stop:1719 length:204 start_codon:yes stop_codon:yes gene_type:complete